MEMWIILVAVLAALAISLLARYAWVRGARASLSGAGQSTPGRRTGRLWGLILLALAYSALLRFLHRLTGNPVLDGGIGVALGLYVCAHPAANAVNLLFFERDTLRQASEWPLVRWLALNLLVLLAGWMVIFVGIRRLVDHPI